MTSSTPTQRDEAPRNALLAAVPAEQFERWRPHLKRVDMPLGHSAYEAGEQMSHVYFPLDCIVSLLYVMENGASAEIALVGNEGVVGVSLFMGGLSTSSRAVVQSAYTQALITQMAQTAVCNRHHSLHQQVCRWLLLSLDRLQGNDLVMTQELIGNMLGVRRASVTAEAKRLQEMGAIRYHRGRITVLDRAILEACTCECYDVVKRESDRLLPPGFAA
jgi:CRP-like cAMP-binding protein